MKQLITSLFAFLIIFLTACMPDTQLDVPPTPTLTAMPVNGSDIADLLSNPPAANESVEIDAYFSGANPFIMIGGPWTYYEDRVNCPGFINNTLTDEPFLAGLTILNRGMSNSLPPEAPWLIAATQETSQPGAFPEAALPYRARLRGHLGDAVFAGCENHDRIFLVDEVVAVFEQDAPGPSISMVELPVDFAEWPRYVDETLGFSFAYPPDWQIEPIDDPALAGGALVRYWERPSFPIMVRVYQGELESDRFGKVLEPPLLADMSLHPYVQGWGTVGMSIPDNQQMPGFTSETEPEPDGRFMAAYFVGDGRTYEVALTYPMGFAASQTLMLDYSVIVESFRLDFLPDPTPTAAATPGNTPTPLPPGVPPPPPTETPSP